MSSAQSAHPFTCNTCQVAFRSSDVQRTHMQTDWHRYNLKRRVASLPPLSSEIFAEKVLANKASAAATAARASFEKSCNLCHKTYYSENAYTNHLTSNKHRAALLSAKRRPGRLGVDDDASSVMSSTFSLGETASVDTVMDGGDQDLKEVVDGISRTTLEDGRDRPGRKHQSQTPSTTRSVASDSSEARKSAPESQEDRLKTCLFCNFAAPSLQESLDHMAKGHGMFIPEQQFLADLEGLINYLFEKVHILKECLWCGKMSSSAYGVQTHMRDLGHCKIAYGTEEEQLEIGEFYDFRSSYSDGEDEDWEDEEAPAEGGVKLGASRGAKIVVEGDDTADETTGDEDGAGWETDSTVSSVPTDELGKVYVDGKDHLYEGLKTSKHHAHNDPRPRKSKDGFHSRAHSIPHAVYYDDFELHMPSGRTAGHRSLNKYFRQNLRDRPVTLEEKLEQRRIADAELAARANGDAMDVDGEEENEDSTQNRGRQLISRANGGMGMIGVTDAKKKEVRAVEKREQKREQRAQAQQQWGNNKKSNMQKHYRDPLLQ